MRKKEQKQQQPPPQPQVSSMEAFKLIDTSFGGKPTTVSVYTQTDNSRNRYDEGVQAGTLERVGSFKNLHGETEKLNRKLLELQQQIQDKDKLISELTVNSSQRQTETTIAVLEKTCNELIQENSRMKTLVLEGAVRDSQVADDTRIRIITKDISTCDLRGVSNPLILKEITELRLFRAAASKEL